MNFIDIYFRILIFILGVAVGSYLNVLVYRIPLQIETVKSRSFCPSCGHKLAVLDLVPVLSYILLRGRCRYCGGRIAFAYAATELANGLLYLLYTVKFGFTLTALGFCVFASCLICVFRIDARHYIIPDRFNLGIVAAGIVVVADRVMTGGGSVVVEHIIGFFSVSAVFYLVTLISKGRAMGGGDVKLAAAAGFVLGWRYMLLAVFIAALTGVAVSGSVYYINKIRKKEASNVVPFGSYLAVGFMAVSFFGDFLLDIYSGIIG